MKVYVCELKELLDLPGSALLTPQRRSRMYRYRQNADRARCLAAGLMLRKVFGRRLADTVAEGEFGKPFLPGGPRFSLSHSGDYVLLAADENDIGADIEQILPWQAEMARLVFTPSEQAWLRAQAGDAAFYRLWTGKEAVMKALGLGFQLPPESFGIEAEGSHPNLVRGRNWYLHWQEMNGHMICIASESPQGMPKPVHLSRNELLENEI